MTGEPKPKTGPGSRPRSSARRRMFGLDEAIDKLVLPDVRDLLKEHDTAEAWLLLTAEYLDRQTRQPQYAAELLARLAIRAVEPTLVDRVSRVVWDGRVTVAERNRLRLAADRVRRFDKWSAADQDLLRELEARVALARNAKAGGFTGGGW